MSFESDVAARRARYTRDSVPTRLGNLASTLARISSFAASPSGDQTVQNTLVEAVHFIEWVGPDADPMIQPGLVDMRVKLARWRLRWSAGATETGRAKLAKQAREFSETVLQWSGLLEAD